MKKLFLLVAFVFSSFAIQAQDKDPILIDLFINNFEVNGGVLTHDSFSGGGLIDTGRDLEIGQASIGFSGDFWSSKKFNFGPAGKVYFHEVGYS